jgi:hypothetical protein
MCHDNSTPYCELSAAKAFLSVAGQTSNDWLKIVFAIARQESEAQWFWLLASAGQGALPVMLVAVVFMVGWAR